jgi:hypothetical protein
MLHGKKVRVYCYARHNSKYTTCVKSLHGSEHEEKMISHDYCQAVNYELLEDKQGSLKNAPSSPKHIKKPGPQTTCLRNLHRWSP